MTQWEAFIKMYNAGCKEYFNPMFGIVIVKNIYKEEKKVSFVVQENTIISFTVNADFKVSDNPRVKQCVFPTSNRDDFVVYVNTMCKHLVLKVNAPICIYRPRAAYTLVFGILTKIHKDHVEVRLRENSYPITVGIDKVLTIQEAKELINNKDNVQSIQD